MSGSSLPFLLARALCYQEGVVVIGVPRRCAPRNDNLMGSDAPRNGNLVGVVEGNAARDENPYATLDCPIRLP